MRRALPFLLKGIGIILFTFILLQIDPAKAITIIERASHSYLLLGFACFPCIYALKTWRWHILSSAAGAVVTPFDSMVMYLSGLFLGIATPGKVGEAIKVPALVARGLNVKDSITITILDRVFDMTLLGIMGIWAVGILFSIEMAAGLVLAGIAMLGIGVLLRHPLKTLHDILLPSIPLKHWVEAGVLTLLNWIVFFLQFWLIAHAFGIEIAPIVFVAIITIAGIVSILPIAPAGLGTRDAALLLLMGQQGVAAETIIAFSFTVFVLTIIASTIGAYFWIRYPLRLNAKT